jgi:hypothetical protein
MLHDATGPSAAVGAVPQRLLAVAHCEALVTRELPRSVPPLEVGIAWHPRRDTDAATMHVVRLLTEIAKKGRALSESSRKRRGAARAKRSRSQ